MGPKGEMGKEGNVATIKTWVEVLEENVLACVLFFFRGDVELFDFLCNRYSPVLNRDHAYFTVSPSHPINNIVTR